MARQMFTIISLWFPLFRSRFDQHEIFQEIFKVVDSKSLMNQRPKFSPFSRAKKAVWYMAFTTKACLALKSIVFFFKHNMDSVLLKNSFRITVKDIKFLKLSCNYKGPSFIIPPTKSVRVFWKKKKRLKKRKKRQLLIWADKTKFKDFPFNYCHSSLINKI